MAPVNFDPALEHFVVHLLKVKLTHEIAYAFDQSFVNTFDESHSTDPVNVHTFTYKLPGDTIPRAINRKRVVLVALFLHVILHVLFATTSKVQGVRTTPLVPCFDWMN
jgi:hypothetical protein